MRLVDELAYARAAVESEPDAGKREYREEIVRRVEAALDKCRKISETVTTKAATTTMAR